MVRKLRGLPFLIFVISLILNNGSGFSQIPVDNNVQQAPVVRLGAEQIEQLTRYWFDAIKQAQEKTGVSNKDFQSFIRFYQHIHDSEKVAFAARSGAGIITPANVNEYKKALVKEWTERYKKFEQIKKDYPSSVAEFGNNAPKPPITCNPGCDNIDFEQGTLNGWNAYYAVNNSNAPPFNKYIISPWVGGPAGAVTEAAYDPNAYGPPLGAIDDYQIKIMSGPGHDPIDPAIPIVSPFGGKYSVRLGDSTVPYYGVAVLQQQFMVTANNDNFTYQYAVLLENPNHTYYNQPFFQIILLDQNNDTIPYCGEYQVNSTDSTRKKDSGFVGVRYFNQVNRAYDTFWCKNWTVVAVPLKKYMGQCVTVEFQVADCAQGGHAGYAYIDASCSPAAIISSSPALCGRKNITLTGPPGASKYKWTGPPGNSIVGSDSSQIAVVDSAGNYTLITTPVTGIHCNDTLTINVAKGANHKPPKPGFTADTICAGQATSFNNTSNPLAGGKFYWDFYNLGNFEDTVDVNPFWTYNTPGVYTVKLHEVDSGCGADTLINVRVDSAIIGTFTHTTVCINQPMAFTNNVTGTRAFKWNFGDPPSGNLDTSSFANPVHIYNTAGTYTVTLIAKNKGSCVDTIKQTVNVLSIPKPVITGTDSICFGGTATLTANPPGLVSYTWTGGVNNPVSQTTTASPTVTTTYTVSVSNGSCSHDTTFTVNVKPLPVPSITAKPDSICAGDSSTLTASGGGTYVWAPSGSTKTSIKVWAGTYTLTVTKNGCTASVTKKVIALSIIPIGISLTKDSICPTDSTSITAQGGTAYKWMPGGSTNPTIKIFPASTTTYTVYITTPCDIDTLYQVVHVLPPPVITTSGNVTICKGTSTKLNVTGGGTYLWNPSSSLTCNTCPNPVASPTATTTYTIAVSNKTTCTKDTTITVTVEPQDASVTPPARLCAGSGSVTLTANPSGDTYQWSNNATTQSITVSPSSTTSYTVIVSNGCPDTLTTSVSVTTPPNLTASFTDSYDTITINKGDTAYMTSHSNVSNYSWSPASSLSCSNCPNPVATPTITTTYTITSDTNGCTVERVLTVYVEVPCADFKVPNVFTPNNDGKNDDFVINVLNPSSYSIIIYDRWGKEMYTSKDPTVYWNGKILNTQKVVPDGVYYYIIKSTCGSNNYVKKGFVQVIGEL